MSFPPFTTEHEQFRDTIKEFAEKEMAPHREEWERAGHFPREIFNKLADLGALGITFPEEYGGLDCPTACYAHIIRELAYASPSVAVTIAVHSMVCEIVNEFADEGVKGQLLSQLAEPGNLSAFAISEPDAGSDPSAAKTRAEKTDGGYQLSGTKMWVTNGVTGRWFVVLARLNDGGNSNNLSMFLLDAQRAGVERNIIHGKMGIRASETAEMALENVFIPEQHLLGEPGWGLRIALSALDGGRIGIASQGVGIANACLDLMVAYAQERLRAGQLARATDATQRAVDLVRTQYVSGLTNFQNVLDTQRTLFELQQQLASSEGQRVQNLVALYRALGGGWDVEATDATMPAGLQRDADEERLFSIPPADDGD